MREEAAGVCRGERGCGREQAEKKEDLENKEARARSKEGEGKLTRQKRVVGREARPVCKDGNGTRREGGADRDDKGIKR